MAFAFGSTMANPTAIATRRTAESPGVTKNSYNNLRTGFIKGSAWELSTLLTLSKRDSGRWSIRLSSRHSAPSAEDDQPVFTLAQFSTALASMML